jgi:hypothetical protein
VAELIIRGSKITADMMHDACHRRVNGRRSHFTVTDDGLRSRWGSGLKW